MAKQTYYELLGVSKTATEDEIKQSYRGLARKYHPDVNSSPDAEERFKEINLAYATLSDSLKRADYDQTLGDTGVRRGGQAAGGYADTGADYVDPTPGATTYGPSRKDQMRAAVARVVAAGLLGAVGGILIQLGVAFALEQSIGGLLGFGALPGALLGALWGADMNFRVESFLGSGWLGRTYTFARTVLMSLSLAFYCGLIGHAIDELAQTGGPVFAAPLILFGVLVGAVVGSDGDTPEKLRSGPGRFNLFYTLLRGAEVGGIGAAIGAALGGILTLSGVSGMLGWGIFMGFALGMIVGSIKPPNLAAYASYASASVKNIIVILMVLGALILGLVGGYLFGPELEILNR